MEPAKVVIHYVNGKILKGYTLDFFPNKEVFHLQPQDKSSSQETTTVMVKDLKGVFFVKDFKGNPTYQDRLNFVEGDKVQGRKIEVLFKDGERMVGTTMGYEPSRPGFFMIPVDAKTNNERAFIVQASVDKVRFV